MSHIFPNVTRVHFYTFFTALKALPGFNAETIQDRKQRIVVGMALYPYDAFRAQRCLSTCIILHSPRLDLGSLGVLFELPTVNDPIGIIVFSEP